MNVLLFKDFLTEEQMLKCEDQMNEPNWLWGANSDPSKKCNLFWNMDLSDVGFFQNDILDKIQSVIPDKIINSDLIYANGQTFGMGGTIHIDHGVPHARTFLMYVNPEYDLNWGGNTTFYNEGETITIPPIPNTAVYFDSNIEHYGDAFKFQDCPLRTTIAFKLLIE